MEGLFLSTARRRLHSRDVLDLIDVQPSDDLDVRQLLPVLALHIGSHDFIRPLLHGDVEVRSTQ